MFKLAHLSDAHLGPMPSVTPSLLANKRVIGLMSWKFRRAAIHSNDVLNRLVTDIRQAGVDHVAFTGDLVNISLPEEFLRGQRWLAELGPADQVSFVPGNHDTYVKVPWENGMAFWGDYMVGDLNMPGVRTGSHNAALFPYVRQRRNIAMIGVTSAVPAPWNKAWGFAGEPQLLALENILDKLHTKGFYRIVMIHHPPLPGQTKDRKALRDAMEMEAVLKKSGAELVLHGHNHEHMHTPLETATGVAHVIGVPSASALPSEKKPPAAWYQFEIERRDGNWCNTMTARSFEAGDSKMVTTSQLCLDRNG